MKGFFRKYVFMMGVPRMEQVFHWIFFTIFSFCSFWSYAYGGFFTFLIVAYIFGGFFLVHALYLRHRYDISEKEIFPTCMPS